MNYARPRLAAIIGVTMLWCAPAAYGQILVAEHTGSSNPTSEGFAQDANGAVIAGPITGDQGLDAWTLSSPGNVRYQTGDLSTATKSLMLAQGWKVTLIARVGAAPDARGLVTANLENLNGRRFDINIGLNGNGDTFVRLNTNISTFPQLVGVGPTFTLTGSGDAYHTYELIYDPVSQTARLLVDGIERLSNYAGHTNFVRTLGFYMGVYENHKGHYNLARLEVLEPPAPVPTVSAWGALAMSLSVLIAGTIVVSRRVRA